jgi:hypothetical protein
LSRRGAGVGWAITNNAQGERASSGPKNL